MTMARTHIEGGSKAVDASTTAADTNGFGKVTLVVLASAPSASVAVTVGDTTTTDTTPTTTLIDPATGLPAVTTGLAKGAYVFSYIGDRRFIKAVGTSAAVTVLLSEPRDSRPE